MYEILHDKNKSSAYLIGLVYYFKINWTKIPDGKVWFMKKYNNRDIWNWIS